MQVSALKGDVQGVSTATEQFPKGEKYENHTGGTWGVDRLPLEWDL
ncbi:MAG: hypothetical protein OXC05_01220 [Halieaceae bacterium]|nr:hypothetical protein [Halieaceae bacterium]